MSITKLLAEKSVWSLSHINTQWIFAWLFQGLVGQKQDLNELGITTRSTPGFCEATPAVRHCNDDVHQRQQLDFTRRLFEAE